MTKMSPLGRKRLVGNAAVWQRVSQLEQCFTLIVGDWELRASPKGWYVTDGHTFLSGPAASLQEAQQKAQAQVTTRLRSESCE